MPTLAAAPASSRRRAHAEQTSVAVGADPTATVLLPCRVRLPDGRVFERPIPAWHHRRLQLSMIHGASSGFVEIGSGWRPAGGRTRWDSRRTPSSFLCGGATPGFEHDWLELALARVAAFAGRRRAEVAVVPSVRREPCGGKAAVAFTRWLWLDVDEPTALPRLHELLRERPPHLRVESAGSGGEHAYWRLAQSLPAQHVDPQTGEVNEWIERAHRRLVRRVGVWTRRDGRRELVGADRACVDRGRLMRLAGTVNHKRGRHARVIAADLALPPYSLRDLVGDLPDLEGAHRRQPRLGRWVMANDPYKRIPPPTYFRRLAGIEVPDRGLVSCPAPDHRDTHPSCNVGDDAETGWWCHGCARGGSVYDLASVLLHGATGAALRGAEFRAAKALVVERMGPLR